MSTPHIAALGAGVAMIFLGAWLPATDSTLFIFAGIVTAIAAVYFGIATRPSRPDDPEKQAAHEDFERKANRAALAIVVGVVALLFVGARWAVNDAVSRGQCPAPAILTVALEDTPWYCVGAHR